MKLKKNIANIISLLNLLLGLIGISLLMQSYLFSSNIIILITSFFDFFDGFIAKKFNITSNFGKRLDTLVDIINFGVAPALSLFTLLNNNYLLYNQFLSYSIFLFVICSVIRLSNHQLVTFNNNYFIGMPITAAAILISSLVLACLSYTKIYLVAINYFLVYLIIIILCILMLSSIRFFKIYFNKNLYIIIPILFFSVYYYIFLFIIVILYILLSIFNHFFIKKC